MPANCRWDLIRRLKVKDQSLDALGRNISSAYSESQSKHIKTLNGKNTEFFFLNVVVHMSMHR